MKVVRGVFSLIVVFSLMGSEAWAEPFKEKRRSSLSKPGHLAIIPTLPQALPRLTLPGKSIPTWQPKSAEEGILFIGSEEKRVHRNQGIYNWLCQQQNPLTGLVTSFDGSSDPMLIDQAATYDQALAGMAFLIMGDSYRAKKILDFYASKWEGKGFYNFYSSSNGRVGMEWRRHVGPNMWLTLFVYQYWHLTRDESYLYLAQGLCDWVMSLPHFNGGPVMSDLDEAEILWREIVSTENVIDSIAVFQIAVQKGSDIRKKKWIAQELAHCKRFIRTVAIQKDGSLARGYRPFIDGVDRTPALDTTTWLISTTLPQNLEKEYGMELSKMLRYAETQFGIQHQNGYGYDFTSADEATQAGRERICSIEWSGEMAQVYWLAAQTKEFPRVVRDQYRKKMKQILKGLDRFAITKAGKISYPYASGEFKLTFADGWHTPKSKADGELAGSVAGTCWRLFADSWNPLRLDQPLLYSPIKIVRFPFREATEKEKKEANYLPSSLTSEGLTTAAWLNLDQGNKEAAKKYALKCIHLYSKSAKEQQAKKAAEGGLVLSTLINEKIKQRVFKFSALNDVAACWFILSKVDRSLRAKASQTVHQNYALAQVWDPAGQFWTVVDALPKK